MGTLLVLHNVGLGFGVQGVQGLGFRGLGLRS